MKKILNLSVIMAFIMMFSSCSKEEALSEIGYLKFDIDTYVSVLPGSRAPIDGYSPKRLQVEVINAAGEVVLKTTDFDHWESKNANIPLKKGRYTVKAQSYGFDGKDSGFDIPFYAGSTEVTVETGVLKTAELVCTLANVKVSVNFEKSFTDAFSKADVTVKSAVSGVSSQNFVMGASNKSAYFPIGNLSAELKVTNKFGKEFSQINEFAKNVKPRSHYILNFKAAQTGSAGNIIVETDDSEQTYTFTFQVSTEASTKLGVFAPLAWSNFAVLTGEILSQSNTTVIDPSNMKFEYKQVGEQFVTWTSVPAVLKQGKYEAKIVGLSPLTQYTYRIVYKGSEEFASKPVDFTTESAVALPNGNLDEWHQVKNTIYPISETEWNLNHRFWDTSNPGTTQGVGTMINKNPTQGTAAGVHTPGGEAAVMTSQYVSAVGIGKFAAGSLYAGKFGGLVGAEGAIMNFGQPFTSRPTQLTGWFKYNAGIVDYVGPKQPKGTLAKGQTDLWTGYIALTNQIVTLNSTELPGAAFDFEKFLKDDADRSVVAYGILPDSECVSSADWKKFTIDLTYKNLDLKPTYIIVVFSSSKYGDYFTGSTSSVLQLDDLELVYGNNPKIK